jgi:putative endopeptidase
VKKTYLLTTLALSLATAFAGAADTANTPSASGIEVKNMDTSVRPQDDFYAYQNGGWVKNTEIPGDRARWGSFIQLQENTLPQLRAIIEAA